MPKQTNGSRYEKRTLQRYKRKSRRLSLTMQHGRYKPIWKGSILSNAIALTYTHEDSWKPEDLIPKNDMETEQSLGEEVEMEVTFQINGGTVRASIVEINPAQRSFVLKEGWEK